MSFQQFKSDSYCVGGRHRSATKAFMVILPLKIKVLFGYCAVCNRKKSINGSDITIQADCLGDFFKNQGKKDLMYQKR